MLESSSSDGIKQLPLRLIKTRPVLAEQPSTMEVPLASASKCELRSVIRFLSAKKVTPIEIHRKLVEVYGEKCMDIKNVRKWSREFNSGHTNVHDEERSGRPSVSDAIVQAVEAEMLKNRRATIRDLEEKLGGVCSNDPSYPCEQLAVSQSFCPMGAETADRRPHEAVNTLLREANGEWYSAGIDKFIVRMRKVLEKKWRLCKKVAKTLTFPTVYRFL